MSVELWKDIEKFENQYQVSNWGRVRQLKHIRIYSSGKLRNMPEELVKFSDDMEGYPLVPLPNNKINRLSRLVAKAFIPNPENKPIVNHVDGNSKNNRADNLEWVTQRENMAKAHRRNNIGKKRPVYCYELSKVFPSMASAEREIGCRSPGLQRAIFSRRPIKGYTFDFYDVINQKVIPFRGEFLLDLK